MSAAGKEFIGCFFSRTLRPYLYDESRIQNQVVAQLKLSDVVQLLRRWSRLEEYYCGESLPRFG